MAVSRSWVVEMRITARLPQASPPCGGTASPRNQDRTPSTCKTPPEPASGRLTWVRRDPLTATYLYGLHSIQAVRPVQPTGIGAVGRCYECDITFAFDNISQVRVRDKPH
ncbi:hypothetical protein C8Q78DRAFT_1057765 [Trametes maxima]|nr:hypothetical protein C8Q78DRAFT_1057765 [Trametes maxima]